MLEKFDDLQNDVSDPENFEFDKKIREIQRKSLSKQPRTSLEVLLEKLQQKLRVNFSNVSDAFRFYDIGCKDKISKEHFVYCSSYFDIDHDIKEVLELFDILDESADGFI